VSRVVFEETVRRHLTSIAFWSYVAFMAIVAFGTAKFNSAAAAWPSFVALLAIITGSAPIGPEFSSGTLQLILVKPVTRSAYLLSRVAGVFAAVCAAALVPCLAELAGRAVFSQPLHANVIGTMLVNVAVDSFFTIALLTFFGSFTRAYFNVALFIVLQVGLAMSLAITMASRNLPALATVLEEVSRNLFPDPPQALDRQWTLLVLSNAAVALVLACLIFRKREVPYGAD
jgi:ABC-type transport system involved in multi-copper enzyme maturation permease subunit